MKLTQLLDCSHIQANQNGAQARTRERLGMMPAAGRWQTDDVGSSLSI